jgi:hypothetical protein
MHWSNDKHDAYYSFEGSQQSPHKKDGLLERKESEQ